eukprot:4844274-Amphidinium_carterae.1
MRFLEAARTCSKHSQHVNCRRMRGGATGEHCKQKESKGMDQVLRSWCQVPHSAMRGCCAAHLTQTVAE